MENANQADAEIETWAKLTNKWESVSYRVWLAFRGVCLKTLANDDNRFIANVSKNKLKNEIQ